MVGVDDKPIYLAGPMSCIPQFNFPMFDAVASLMRAKGWDIQSPAELDEDDVRNAALASKDGAPMGRVGGRDVTWGDFLARDVKLLADECGGVLLLPGWEGSKGARLEAFVAILTGLPLWEYQPAQGAGTELPHGQAMRLISNWTIEGNACDF